MTPVALALVATAAVMHASWNALSKGGRDPLLFLWSSMLLAAVVMAPAAAFYAGGVDRAALPWLAATSVLHAAYFVTLGLAYRAGELTRVYPVARGLGVALVAVVSWTALGVAPSAAGAAGVAAVVAGMAVIASAGGARGLGWAIATGALIASYSLVDDRGVDALHPLPYVVGMSAGACTLLAPLIATRRAALVAEWRAGWRKIALAACFNLSGYLLVLFAMRLSSAEYVVASREMSIIASLVLARLVVGERPTRRRIAGAVVIAAGVAGIAMA